MKKLMAAALLAGVMGVNAFAGLVTDATVTGVKVKADSTILLQATSGGNLYQFDMTGIALDTQKAMLASMLSAKAAGSLVDVRFTGTTIVDITVK